MAILGLAISHDASAALTTENGVVVAAIAEERIHRIKSFSGLPLSSIQRLTDLDIEINKVVIGSHVNLKYRDAIRFAAQLDGNPSNPRGSWNREYPGFRSRMMHTVSAKAVVENLLKQNFLGLREASFEWVKHHDSHLGCSLAASGSGLENCLLVSLDGEGDGESGAIATIRQGGQLQNIARIDALDSLGSLYSAVTSRYNFRPNEHEGKITGLAAFGKHSAAVDLLRDFITVSSGKIRIKQVKGLKSRLLGKSLRAMGLSSKLALTLSEIVDLAEGVTSDYPDLAFAVQSILESSVLEVIEYYIEKTKLSQLGLAGGVFANVKLNQRISELHGVKSINVFPNMGDGGISLGGIWSLLQSQGRLTSGSLYQDMYLAPLTDTEDENTMKQISSDPRLAIEKFSGELELIRFVAEQLDRGLIVAVHRGRMEFGPRALCNRSLLADPRTQSINTKLNERLGRTEFMPFAPIVPIEKFEQFFYKESSQMLTPYKFMTITCRVRDEKRSLIPAVVHVDGTARPQVISEESNPFAHKILLEFAKFSGCPVLINTSLNIHGEPINYTLADSVKPLLNGAYDFLVLDNDVVIRKALL